MTANVDPATVDRRLARVLPAGSLFAVGGRIRDEVRTSLDGIVRAAKDLDYVVAGLTFDELVGRLAAIGRPNVVGASFAVVKIAVEGHVVDVALPRRERSTGAGHREFEVEFGPNVSLTDDLARRDFRMNMLARGLPAGELLDPYGGAADIASRQVDILADDAFQEDPLRILRACQFAARFEFTVTPRTLAAMGAAAPLVASVSPDRMHDELVKLLGARRPSLGFEAMRATGVLPYVLPEVAEGIGVEQNAYHAYDVYTHNLATLDATPPGDLILRWSGLLHDVGKPRTKDGPHFYRHEVVGAEMTETLLGRLRFSNADVDAVAALVRHHMYPTEAEMTDAAVRRFIRRVGVQHLGRQFALRKADIAGSGLPKRGDANENFEARVAALCAEAPALDVRDLAVDGNDVIAAAIRHKRLPAGSRGGAIVGLVLRELLDDVVENPERNERSLLLQAIERMVSA